MDPRLQDVIDHHEIRQVLAHYCHGCDRCDEVEMASVYAEDSWDDHGSRSGKGRQFAHDMTLEGLQTTKVVSHLLGQSLIRVHGETAGAETYFLATLTYLDPEQSDQLSQMGGRYVDTLIKEDGAWRIKRRVTVREWSVTHTVSRDDLGAAGFVETVRGAADVSYETLKLPFLGRIIDTVAGGGTAQ